MKKALIYTVSLCTAFMLVIACTTNEFEDPKSSTAGNALIFNSLDRGLSGTLTDTRISDTVTLKDLSILSNGRTWTFPAGAVDILGSGNDNTSTKEEIRAIFKTEGAIEVYLEPNFTNPPPNEVARDTARFNVRPLIVADFTTNIPVVGGDLILEAGETVTFTNTSSEMEAAEWTITNTTTGVVTTSQDLSPQVQFSSLGSYTVQLRAFTPVPFTQDFKTIEFQVIPSSQPLTVNPGIIENEAGQIVISFSRDLDPTTLDDASSFTLLVDGMPAVVSAVLLQADNAANLLVVPAQNIKNSQEATIAYNAVNLLSADAAPAPDIPTTNIEIFAINVFANGVFEGIDGPTGGAYGTGGFLTNDPGGNISAAVVAGEGIDGSSALVYTFAAGAAAGHNRSIFGDGDASNIQRIEPLENGEVYIMKAFVKYTGSAPQEFKLSISHFPFNGQGFSVGSITSGFVDGNFVELSAEFTIGNGTFGGDGIGYPIINARGSGGASTVTIDNIRIFKKEL